MIVAIVGWIALAAILIGISLLIIGISLLIMGIYSYSKNDFIFFSMGWGSMAVGIILGIVFLSVGQTTNIEYLREKAPQYFANNGMKIIADEGYIRTTAFGKTYGGGNIWYHVCYTNRPNVIYKCYLKRWGKDNIQTWNFRPLNKYLVVDGNAVINLNE